MLDLLTHGILLEAILPDSFSVHGVITALQSLQRQLRVLQPPSTHMFLTLIQDWEAVIDKRVYSRISHQLIVSRRECLRIAAYRLVQHLSSKSGHIMVTTRSAVAQSSIH